ncbi:LOW QUALITY PROTEIN: stromal membrane-associated protein 1 [Alosa sapidissima]|uniref:LOW QUALITY PROTEIN: stromal membrane-associated protein 1 n=1 Tax=Alosa sapidissima TaxID=34773 RepID=UPI001C09CE99|nr:LOW QUALITY PROTEIN: stromal membrane-associated protein 1 [Alosa sapidissima]
MTTRSEREKAQKLNEQHQAILSKMLREDDNKYCADCEAKGPRWASWNLGVFICIRCAGIHRNLGVHISRVKSVNLDQWTPEQMQSVQDMGNTRARQLYEAHLPENFRRPQTDQYPSTHCPVCVCVCLCVCVCVRVRACLCVCTCPHPLPPPLPPPRRLPPLVLLRWALQKAPDVAQSSSSSSPSSQASEKNKLEKEREKKKDERKREKDTDKSTKPSPLEKKREDVQSDSKPSPRKNAEPSVDLLGLDIAGENFIVEWAKASSSKAPGVPAAAVAAPGAPSGAAVEAAPTSSSQGELDLFSEGSGGGGKAEENAKKPLSKDSILSLYGSSTVPQQPTQAAMFMGASQMQFPTQPPANFQAFPGMGGPCPPTTMMGAVMGQGAAPAAMMGQNATGMMVGMTMPNGFMGGAQAAGVMGLAPGMMGAQAGRHPAGVVPPQNMYAMQPGQQPQWNMAQMNQQMTGMSLNGSGAPMSFAQPGAPMGGWVGPPSGQTLSTQLWK